MTAAAPLLLELGTEELPPKALAGLGAALVEGVRERLTRAALAFGDIESFASPRRLALLIHDLALRQSDRVSERRGPALAAAYDAAGAPTQATLGFARSCGVTLEQLQITTTEKGRWLSCVIKQPGAAATEILPALIVDALQALPVPRRMRWGSSDAEFVRPVHWLVLLHGEQIVPAHILGVAADRITYGHRFLAPAAIMLAHAADYAATLRQQGKVIAGFAARREMIRLAIEQAAKAAKGTALVAPDLLDEVTALVEWPVALTGAFAPEFLALPEEVLLATMQNHQRYFPLRGTDGRLLDRFITIVNIDSPHPERIIAGNQRVIQPRLKDAQFFWEQDRRTPLAERLPAMAGIVFEQQLGSLHDKTERTLILAEAIGRALDLDLAAVRRAAQLSRCDLVTGMVGEFPELQGVMGHHYALASGEAAAIARALEEFYLPRFAGDALPTNPFAQAIGVADRLDTLVGITAIGKEPTGDKDPYALRRHALAVLRICIERELDLDLVELITIAAGNLGALTGTMAGDGAIAGSTLIDRVHDFLLDRLRAYYSDREVPFDVFDAVRARRPARPLDFDRRVRAVAAFRALPQAASLAAANKRSANILAKLETPPPAELDPALLALPAEQALTRDLATAASEIAPLLATGDYAAALLRLAALRDSVDAFFDAVLVWCDDPAVRANRLALVARLRHLFTGIADISRLNLSS
ncbi:MAG: glycine--tRNA ligase subunit beta [Gammaproteobacteria bacterium]|nr:glycine--tRNA ligase subunit beta [Gammaproteobacteria bacterium]